MFKRIGKCNHCGRCCQSFNLLAGAMSDFRKAGIHLFRNKDGTYRCSMLKANLCTIHGHKPKPCQEAPRAPFPWECGYRFIEIKQPRREKRETKKTIHLLSEVNPGKRMDSETNEILQYGRLYLMRENKNVKN